MTGGSDGLSIWGILAFGMVGFVIGGALFVAFWSLIGSDAGMRLLSASASTLTGPGRLGLRRATKRLLASAARLVPAGARILRDPPVSTRRGWHDRIAGTTVVYDEPDLAAPWSTTSRGTS